MYTLTPEQTTCCVFHTGGEQTRYCPFYTQCSDNPCVGWCNIFQIELLGDDTPVRDTTCEKVFKNFVVRFEERRRGLRALEEQRMFSHVPVLGAVKTVLTRRGRNRLAISVIWAKIFPWWAG